MTTNQTKIPATDPDVLAVAKDLIATANQTTTLQVKHELRNRGFWVDQRDVSTAMDRAANAGELAHDDGAEYGIHRVYTLPVAPTVTATGSNPFGTSGPLADLYNKLTGQN